MKTDDIQVRGISSSKVHRLLPKRHVVHIYVLCCLYFSWFNAFSLRVKRCAWEDRCRNKVTHFGVPAAFEKSITKSTTMERKEQIQEMK